MILINGEAADVAGQTLADYLTASGYDIQRVAVERNLEIVPKSGYQNTILQDGDTLEVVSFVGGG